MHGYTHTGHDPEGRRWIFEVSGKEGHRLYSLNDDLGAGDEPRTFQQTFHGPPNRFALVTSVCLRQLSLSNSTITMSIVTILLCLFLPPVAVFTKKGLGMDFIINLVLSLLLLWIGGIIHAFWICSKK